MASNSKNLAELLNGDITVTATDIADGSVTAAKLASTLDISGKTVTLPDGVVTESKWGGLQLGGSRNLIINGSMEVDQRETYGSAATSASTNFVRSIDGNWFCVDQTDGQCSYEQVIDAPVGTGLRFSQKVTVTSTDTSLAANQRFCPTQGVEGYTWNHLMWHTSDAKDIAVQFWVKSSVTGTYGFTIRTGSAGYSYCQPYTISQANTWEKKTFTIPAPTSLPNGGVGNANGTAYYLIFGLGLGSDYDVGADETWTSASNGQGRSSHTNLMATNGATWQLTGFQIEQGTTHTPFEHESYNVNLTKCMRYYQRHDHRYYFRVRNDSRTSQNPDWAIPITFPQPMCRVPDVTTYSDYFVTTGYTSTGGSNLGMTIDKYGLYAIGDSNNSGGGVVGALWWMELSAEL